MDSEKNTPERKLNVIIVGAGIAGLCAAIALRRAGHRVKILERSPHPTPPGAAITLAPNAIKLLRSWGLDFRRAKLTQRLGQTFIDGTTLAELSATDRTDFEAKYGAPYFFAHRVDFQAALKELATGEGGGPGEKVELQLGRKVVEYDVEGGRVKVAASAGAGASTNENGVEEDAWSEPFDLIVAADGVHSRAAFHVTGKPCPAHATRSTVIRFLIPTAQLLDDPATAPLLSKYGDGHCSFYLHSDRQRWLVRYPCHDNTMQNFGMYVEQDISPSASSSSSSGAAASAAGTQGPGEAEKKETWTQHLDSSALRAALTDFHPSLADALVSKTDSHKILPLWRCAERAPLPTCQREKLVVIGDASHPMLPHRGFGAVMAIEDAGCLGALFETGHDGSRSVETMLKVFEKVRLPRSSVAQLYSQVETNKDPTVERRDAAREWLPQSELPASAGEVIDWVFGYDVLQATRQAMKDGTSIE